VFRQDSNPSHDEKAAKPRRQHARVVISTQVTLTSLHFFSTCMPLPQLSVSSASVRTRHEMCSLFAPSDE
jgi:hypothetical protein